MSSPDFLTLAAGAAVAFTSFLFARALIHKLADFTTFTGYVADYDLVPPGMVRSVSALVVLAEGAVVAGLLLPPTRLVAALLAVAILLGYGYAIASAVRAGRRWIECGCGGAVQPVGWPLVARNVALSLIALVGALGGGPLSKADIVAVLAAGITIFVGYLLVEQILGNAAATADRA